MAIKIYIDQGHNPNPPNSGAEGNGLREQDITYEVGIRLKRLLDQNGSFETRLSRPTSTTQLGSSNASSLRVRVDEANSWGADYFVSIHTNASVQASANGTEVLVYVSPSRAADLARDVLREVTEITGLRSRGVKERPGLYVLRKTNMPAILVELGFITNPSDAALMESSPSLFARGIYQVILDYLGI